MKQKNLKMTHKMLLIDLNKTTKDNCNQSKMNKKEKMKFMERMKRN